MKFPNLSVCKTLRTNNLREEFLITIIRSITCNGYPIDLRGCNYRVKLLTSYDTYFPSLLSYTEGVIYCRFLDYSSNLILSLSVWYTYIVYAFQERTRVLLTSMQRSWVVSRIWTTIIIPVFQKLMRKTVFYK